MIQVSPSTCRPKPPSQSLLVARVAGVRLAALEVEGVRRGAHADDRLARLDVIDDVLHLLVGQIAEAREDDHQVGRLERLQAGDVVVAGSGLIVPSLVDGEQHGALEAVMLGQDLGQLRQGLLGAIFLVAADQDDVLALAGAIAPLNTSQGSAARAGDAKLNETVMAAANASRACNRRGRVIGVDSLSAESIRVHPRDLTGGVRRKKAGGGRIAAADVRRRKPACSRMRVAR